MALEVLLLRSVLEELVSDVAEDLVVALDLVLAVLRELLDDVELDEELDDLELEESVDPELLVEAELLVEPELNEDLVLRVEPELEDDSEE